MRERHDRSPFPGVVSCYRVGSLAAWRWGREGVGRRDLRPACAPGKGRRAMTLSHLAQRVDTADGHPQVLNRVQRWATVTDSRIVRRLWPAQPAGAQHALCPSCGGTMPNGMLVTLNQMAPSFPAGPAYRAITAGDVGPLTPDLPIEPGELWCVVCLPCLEDDGLSAHLLALVDDALQSD